MIQEFKKHFLNQFSAKHKTTLYIALGVLGMLLILLSEFPFHKKDAKQAALVDTQSDYNAQYIQALEEDLCNVLSRIAGVGDVIVSITLESGVRYEYATEGRSTFDEDYRSQEQYATESSSETSIILVEGENGKEPLLLRRIEPTVQGVAIVCSGGGDPVVREEIVRTACVLCGVKSNRVSVSQTQ